MSTVVLAIHAPFQSLEEIERFVVAFENCTLPRAEWTHRAHLTMAAWYLSHQPQPVATETIRSGILKLNSALGIVTDADHGYHETITQFYAGMIAHHLRHTARGDSLLEAVNLMLATRGAVDLPLKYYSRERLMSREARTRWVEPDLQPLEWEVTPPSRGA